MQVLEKPIQFVVNIDADIPSRLIGDEVRIRQVLVNLLGNAVKYTNNGFIKFTVYYQDIADSSHGLFHKPDNSHIMMFFSITDSGLGIKDEDFDKLFGDFTQFDTHVNKKVTGTGLGLAIAKRLTRQMDGDITVQSTYGKGSTFTASMKQQTVADSECPPFACVENAENIKALVYEEREVYAASVLKTLDNLGVPCKIATTHGVFKKIMKNVEYSPDFIFTSIQLFEDAVTVLNKYKESNNCTIVQISPTANMKTLISKHGTKVRQIAMPVYAISVANILNGTEARIFNQNSETSAKFTAPTARILIVDDIRTNLKITEGLLAPFNTKIDTAENGMTAIELVKKYDYDIIFMDHMMPEMDGVETVAEIRKLGGSFENITIIALTANALTGMKEMFLLNGFNDYIAKPIETVKLFEMVGHWMPDNKKVFNNTLTDNNTDNSTVSHKAKHSTHSDKHNSTDSHRTKHSTHSDRANSTRSDNKDDSTTSDSTDNFTKFEALFKDINVDVKHGLHMVGGKFDVYVDVLEQVLHDTEERLKYFQTVPHGSDECKVFAIHVHALKGVLSSVGAEEISKMAATLEKAGREGDSAAIERELGRFRNGLVEFVSAVTRALKEI
jgi:CheY-like chemotaxis protein/HPt (histidine-containing phosphotransfer) domain-containing protein